MKVQERIIEVMKEVGAVGKTERNTHQNFNFRGIDAVINAVSPALQKHGVIVMPTVLESDYSTVEIGAKRTPMGHARVRVMYTFIGLEGDTVTATVVAESMDSGDKATAKAMSVAMRTALLQSLALPTSEADPDASTYERSSAPEKVYSHTSHAEPLALSPEQVALAKEAIDQVPAINTIAELKMFWDGANQAQILNILVDGTTLGAVIGNRKKELEA